MKDSNDHALVEGLRRGDEAAFRELIRLHQHRVYTIAFRMIGDAQEAADVAQDVFVAVFQSIGSFREDSLLSTWLHRIALNRTRNHLKYMRRRRAGMKVAWDAGHGPEPRPGTTAQYPTMGRTERPDRSSEDRELARRALDALRKVEVEYREALVLHEIEGLPYEEIAAIAGVAVGTVKSRIFRGRAALRKALLEDGPIPIDEEVNG